MTEKNKDAADLYKSGVRYAVINPKNVYKSGGAYGTISTKDF